MSLWWSSRVVAWVWWVLVARTAAVVGRSTLGMQPTQDVRSDQETMNYLLPRLADNFAPVPWQQVMDPRLYVLSELEAQNKNTVDGGRSKREYSLSISDAQKVLYRCDEKMHDANRGKRRLPSLSIVNPMEVLRQRLLLEIARKQQRENAVRKAGENRVFLQQVGKRTELDNDINHLFLDDNDIYNILPVQERAFEGGQQRHRASEQLRREREDEE